MSSFYPNKHDNSIKQRVDTSTAATKTDSLRFEWTKWTHIYRMAKTNSHIILFNYDKNGMEIAPSGSVTACGLYRVQNSITILTVWMENIDVHLFLITIRLTGNITFVRNMPTEFANALVRAGRAAVRSLSMQKGSNRIERIESALFCFLS